MAEELWESTLSLLERGREEDARGALAAAHLLYSEAVGGIHALLDLETSERRRELLAARLKEYCGRLAELNTVLQQVEHADSRPNTEQVAGPRPIETGEVARKAASELANARLCAELAVQVDEARRDPQEAIPLYTKAAEWYLAALRLEKGTSDEAELAKIRRTMSALLDRAEELKRATPSTGRTSSDQSAVSVPTPPQPATKGLPPAPKPPTSASAEAPSEGQRLSAEEKAVLARSSRISGRMYYPWVDDGQREQFAFSMPWEDPEGLLALSSEQRLHFGRWARPSEFMRGEPKMIYLVSAYTITQTIITDCSFVSSLVIAAAYERKFRKQLITKIIYPQDRHGVPIYNPAGKYMIKLNFNGVPRKILVDDRIPISKDGKPMCSHSSHGEELWVSIIEKAYMKVNGGYDFPGSNSGIDMYALTGWIPEQFRMGDPDFNAQRLWERMVSSSRYGDCLVTVATGELAEDEAERVGLVPTHAYAVLQVREVQGVRLLQLKNPWAKTRWRGAYSVHDKQRWTVALRAELQYDLMGAMQQDNGVFWIDYDSLRHFFVAVYLNWNPQLFKHRTVTHGQWPVVAKEASTFAFKRDDTVTLSRNPQYALSVSVGVAQLGSGSTAAIWILLSRHTVRKDQGSDDFLTLHLAKERGGFRVYYLETVWMQGIYSNRPHCLIKFDLPAGNHRLTLILAQYKEVAHITAYTLEVYSMASFALRKLPYSMRHSQQLVGAWKGLQAGGCANFDSCVDNPKYLIVVEQTTDFQVELEAANSRFAVALQLHSEGSKHPCSSSSALSASGDYRGGFCLLEARAVPPGRYELTPSTFEPRQECAYSLTCGSSAQVSVRPLPHEGHGLTRHVINGHWSVAAGSGAGSANHGAYHCNPQVRFSLSSPGEALLRLRCPSSPAHRPSALGLALYGTQGRLGLDWTSVPRIAAANDGVYSYPVGGIVVPRLRLPAGNYVCVASTFDPFTGPFELIIYLPSGVSQPMLLPPG